MTIAEIVSAVFSDDANMWVNAKGWHLQDIAIMLGGNEEQLDNAVLVIFPDDSAIICGDGKWHIEREYDVS